MHWGVASGAVATAGDSMGVVWRVGVVELVGVVGVVELVGVVGVGVAWGARSALVVLLWVTM